MQPRERGEMYGLGRAVEEARRGRRNLRGQNHLQQGNSSRQTYRRNYFRAHAVQGLSGNHKRNHCPAAAFVRPSGGRQAHALRRLLPGAQASEISSGNLLTRVLLALHGALPSLWSGGVSTLLCTLIQGRHGRAVLQALRSASKSVEIRAMVRNCNAAPVYGRANR